MYFLAGMETPRISLDMSNGSSEATKSSNAKIEYKPHTHETRKSSATKKKGGGLPMKTLIAEEMSKEIESKHRTPGVVARLMGLDALPAESVLAEQVQLSDNHAQKNMQLPKPVHERWRVSGSKPTQEVSLSKSWQQTIDHRDQKILPGTQDHSLEKQMQGFKKDFEAFQASLFQDHSKPHQQDELNVQLVEKHMLVHEKLDEAKMSLVREKFIDAKHLATDEKLQQSKEFLDALEVLQSNKDLFLKFLQEPNSLFAKHLQDLQSASQPASETKKAPNMKSTNVFSAHEVLRKEDPSQGRNSKENKKLDKRFQKQKGHHFLAEREEERHIRSSPPGNSVSICSMQDQYKQYPAASAKGKNDIGPLPTRIVVLKPGPGSAQNLRPASPPSCSPRSETAFRNAQEAERASTRDFLQEIRERLKLGLKENRKDDSRITQERVRDQINDGPKDPREIAREIARQVRESVTRDLTSDPSRLGEVSTSFTSFSGKGNSLNRSRNSSVDVGVSSDTEISTPVTKHLLDHTSRFCPPPLHSLGKSSNSSDSTVNREAKKRLSERLRLTHGDGEEQQSRQNSSTLGKMLAFPEDKNQVSESKDPKQTKKVGVGEDDSPELPTTQIRDEIETDYEGSLDHRNGDENGVIPPRDLLRSQSVSSSTTNFDRDDIQMQSKVSDVSTRNAHEMDLDSSANLPTDFLTAKNDKSTLKEKVSSLKGSFLLRGRKSSSKNSDSLNTMQSNTCLQVHLYEKCDPLKEVFVESEQSKLSEDLDNLEHQESLKPMIDTPDMKTEPLELPAGTGSSDSFADDKGSEGPILEASDWAPVSVQIDAAHSVGSTEYLVEPIPEQQPPSSPTSCSSSKKLPLDYAKAPESNNEKAEQPSPVSVLDAPFQEETRSPKGFKEISSNLQELRLRLDLLKFDGSEKPMHNAEKILQGDGLVLEDLEIGDADIFNENTCNSPSEAEISLASRVPSTVSEKLDFQSLDDISCPKEKEPDLLYVRNVLVASGFTGDGIFARWHLPSHPLDPLLFEKIENIHLCDVQHEMKSTDYELVKTEAHRRKSERHLIFDCINEVLLEILGPFFNRHPWARDTKLNLRPMPAGKQLLKETWEAISRYLYTQSDTWNTLENIVARDLSKQGMWMDLRSDVEIVGRELERAIFSDLIEELISDLAS
eukprot:Gb_27743 [translate_table: standard]